MPRKPKECDRAPWDGELERLSFEGSDDGGESEARSGSVRHLPTIPSAQATRSHSSLELYFSESARVIRPHPRPLASTPNGRAVAPRPPGTWGAFPTL